MNLLLNLAILVATIWILRLLTRRRPKRYSQSRRWALALAQPMVDACGPTFFHVPEAERMSDTGSAYFRSVLLHQLAYRVDAGDDEVRRHLAQEFEAQWFRIDLQALRPEDDPRAALAFACVRVAHLTRIAEMMGWIDPAAGWRVLLLNAQRARECFESWEDLGRAYLAGRAQWIGALRADPLGKVFDEAQLRTLLARRDGWSTLPWPGTALALPLADSRTA